MGAFCDTVPCPDDCSSNGLCMGGICMCDQQHFGDSCQHERCIEDCNGHGYCFQARCQCTGDYGGESCSELVHTGSVIHFKLAEKKPVLNGAPSISASTLRSIALPGCATNCSGHGQCLQGGLGGCGCDSGWSGSECSDFCPNQCSGNGDCIHGSCLCLSGWSRADCSQQSCCSGHGSCATPDASCNCDHGWTGTECNIEMLCPDATCSGHGVCTHGSCMCGPGYSGPACAIPHRECGGLCGQHGTCDLAIEECVCSVGWTGPHCTVPPPAGLLPPSAPESFAGTDNVIVVEHHPEDLQLPCMQGLVLIQGADGKLSCGEQTTSSDPRSQTKASMMAETHELREPLAVPSTGSWIPSSPASKVVEETVTTKLLATNIPDPLPVPASATPATQIVNESLETFASSPSVLSILAAAGPAASKAGSAKSFVASKAGAHSRAAVLPPPQTRDEAELIRMLEVGRPASTADDGHMPAPLSSRSLASLVQPSVRHEHVGLIEVASSESRSAVVERQKSLLGLLASAASPTPARQGGLLQLLEEAEGSQDSR